MEALVNLDTWPWDKTRRVQNGAFVPIMLSAALVGAAPSAWAEYKSEFIPFPQVTFNSNDKDIPGLSRENTDLDIDFFYTADIGQARLLAEFFLTNEEREFERLVVGWAAGEDTRIWLGRYHTALGEWNHKYHHGVYLQPTIYRPGIIDFEDDGGVIPTHATGLAMETTLNSASHATHLILNVGLGPQLMPTHLQALDILHPDAGNHDFALTLAASRHSYARPADNLGLFLGFFRIPSSVPGIEQVEQHIIGGYFNRMLPRWHVSGSVFWVDINLEMSGDQKNSSLAYGYIQPEYPLNSKWTLYARVEATGRGDDNLYLRQIPAFVSQRALMGARYQFPKAQALKIEMATLEQYGTRFNQVALQWSAAIP